MCEQLFLYQLGEQRDTMVACMHASMHGLVCVCMHQAQTSSRLWLCAAGWVKPPIAPFGPQGKTTLPWVSTQSAMLPCPGSLEPSRPQQLTVRPFSHEFLRLSLHLCHSSIPALYSSLHYCSVCTPASNL